MEVESPLPRVHFIAAGGVALELFREVSLLPVYFHVPHALKLLPANIASELLRIRVHIPDMVLHGIDLLPAQVAGLPLQRLLWPGIQVTNHSVVPQCVRSVKLSFAKVALEVLSGFPGVGGVPVTVGGDLVRQLQPATVAPVTVLLWEERPP